MIAWSIEAAKASGCFDRIIVSTDDETIASIAKEYGAETPFIRPQELSDDYAGTLPVIKHCIEYLLREGQAVDQVCCLYATAPFVSANDLQIGCELLNQYTCDYVFSVAEFTYPIQRALNISDDNRVAMFQPENFHIRSQDLEQAYHDAGQFYWGTLQAWLEEKPFFISDAVPVILPRERVQDIDTPDDWNFAEKLFELLHFGSSTKGVGIKHD